MGQVYIVHFSEKYGHARHYTGFVKGDGPLEPFRRFRLHLLGKGSRFLNRVNEAGIRFKLVRIFTNQTRTHERNKKKYAARLCPVCKMESKQGKQLGIRF